MAVLPHARRAIARPSRLPWLIAAAALVAITLTFPGYPSLHQSARNFSPSLPVAETSSTATHASAYATDAGDNQAPALASLTTAQQQALLANLAASGGVTVAQEAALVALPSAGANSDAANGHIAEASSTSVVAGQAGNSATSATQAASVPAAQSATDVASPAQVPATTSTSPIERWAAYGIDIETKNQNLDAASLANINAALSALPTNVLSQLGNPAFGPLHILVNKEGRVLSGDEPYGGPANFFSTNEATNELVLYPDQSVFTIEHELGHAYNLRHVGAGRYAMVLLDPQMQSFLAATGWIINSTDAQIRAAVDHLHVSYTYTGAFHWSHLSHDDPLEDFANTFATYFLDPQGLKTESPARYAWMSSTFGQ